MYNDLLLEQRKITMALPGFSLADLYSDKMSISSNGNIGIGSGGLSAKMSMNDYKEYVDILRLAETNSAVKSALDKLRITYYLSKEDGNRKT